MRFIIVPIALLGLPVAAGCAANRASEYPIADWERDTHEELARAPELCGENGEACVTTGYAAMTQVSRTTSRGGRPDEVPGGT